MRVPDWLVYTLVLATIVTVLFLRGGGEGELAPQPPVEIAEPAPIPQIEDESRPDLAEPNPFDERVLVQVGEVEDGIGTAFAINRSGLWITARHVVDGCREVGLAIGNGRIAPVEEVVRSSVSDLALLYTNRAPVSVPVRSQAHLRVGDEGYHVGYPQGRTGEVASRLMSRSRLVTRGRYSLDESVLAWVEAARSPGFEGTLAGMSGGPVFDANGEVIGVTVAESPRRGRIYTASPESIEGFLDRRSAVALGDGARPIAAATYEAEADRLRKEKAVVMVICRADTW